MASACIPIAWAAAAPDRSHNRELSGTTADAVEPETETANLDGSTIRQSRRFRTLSDARASASGKCSLPAKVEVVLEISEKPRNAAPYDRTSRTQHG